MALPHGVAESSQLFFNLLQHYNLRAGAAPTLHCEPVSHVASAPRIVHKSQAVWA
jgi:hypothetical protein